MYNSKLREIYYDLKDITRSRAKVESIYNLKMVPKFLNVTAPGTGYHHYRPLRHPNEKITANKYDTINESFDVLAITSILLKFIVAELIALAHIDLMVLFYSTATIFVVQI